MVHRLPRRFVVAIALVGVVAVAGCADTTNLGDTETREEPPTINESAVEMWIHRFVNEERRARGLDPLARNETLDAIASYHSSDMANEGYYAHESPSGETVRDRYVKFGIDCWDVYGETKYLDGSENIAQTYHHRKVNVPVGGTRYHETAKSVARGLVDQWMNSTGHRKNILSPDWTSEGVGIAVNGTHVYATQNFCKRSDGRGNRSTDPG